MGLSSGRWLPRKQMARAAWVVLLLLALAAAWDGWQWQARQMNRLIQNGQVPTTALGPPELLFAQAVALAASGTAGTASGKVNRDATSGADRNASSNASSSSNISSNSSAIDSAINRYGTLVAHSALGRAARYNAANLLLRQAIELHNKQQPGQALALVELAKEGFREVLRQEPTHWAARYNLERAQRLVPDPAADADFPNEAPAAAERSATTMRGYTPGLP
jgi:mxaK protein